MIARKIVGSGLVVTGLALLGACSDGAGPSANQGKAVTLSVSTGRPAAGASAAAPESLTVGGHTIALTKVEIVLRQIRLKRVNGSLNCEGESESESEGYYGPSASGGSDGSGKGGDDNVDCEEVAVGPLLVNLPLGGGLQRVLQVPVDTGTFRRVEFRIQKPESNDQAFVAANPDFAKLSIRATGTFDGKPFVYLTDLGAKQRSALVPPLVVTDSTSTDLTMVVDVSKWFVATAGLVDPSSALKGQANERLVRDNIRRSFRLLCDGNHDGQEDR